ncbi:hypothetical protein BCV72DRAFT_266112 [Rhizopus microsporus var. microsporus]|nr:hypothetical protein BCV72DRAFT_266112 [Rhizopus microsporus var. microsporus]
MSSDFSSNLSPKPTATSGTLQSRLIRIVKAQTSLLVTDLNINNYIERSTEINTLIKVYGEDIRKHLFYYLLVDISKDLKSSSPQVTLLTSHLSLDHSLISLCHAFGLLCTQNTSIDLDALFTCLELDYFSKIIISVSLFRNANRQIYNQVMSIFKTDSTRAKDMLTNTIIPSNLALYFIDCFATAISDKVYEPTSKDLEWILMLAKQYPSDNDTYINVFQAMLLESIQKEETSYLRDTLIACKSQSLSTEDTIRFIEHLVETYVRWPTLTEPILQTINEQEMLPYMLNILPPIISLDLASAASRQNMINLETWLPQKMKAQSDIFIPACLDYLSQKIIIKAYSIQQEVNGSKPVLPSAKELEIILKTLANSITSPYQFEQYMKLQNQCYMLYPDLINTNINIQDIEREADAYYERLYNDQLSVDDMLSLMKQLKTVGNRQEQQLFQCMIHVLFDEYEFFSKYPEKELMMTSKLFGQLIQQDIMPEDQLDSCFLFILDALRNSAQPRMIAFGIDTVKQFIDRLDEWPQFCKSIVELPGLVQVQPRFIHTVRRTLMRSRPISFTSIHLPAIPNSAMSELDGLFEVPEENTQRRLITAFNSIQQDSTQSKIEEFTQVLKPTFYQWFSRYLIAEHIIAGSDNQTLCLSILRHINSKLLDACVLYESFLNILHILHTTDVSTAHFDALTNLGSWLGKITLAQNKPILEKHMAMKGLLLQSYDVDRLTLTLPLVCRVLKQGSYGRVFIPPNPWLMGILSLLAEIYEYGDIPVGLKHEIEALCKSLSIKLKDINIASILRNRRVIDY